MHKSCSPIYWVMFACIVTTAMVAYAAQPSKPLLIDVGMTLSVDADGKVTGVEPDSDLPQPVRDALIKGAGSWRFTSASWDGRVVSTRSYLSLHLEAVPVAQGGFALRVSDRTDRFPPGYKMGPPIYPREALESENQALLIYALRIDEQGRVTEARLADPENSSSIRSGAAFDAASRVVFNNAQMMPFVADGVSVACEIAFPMSYALGVASEVAKTRDAQTKQVADLLAHPCPRAELQTKIEGLVL